MIIIGLLFYIVGVVGSCAGHHGVWRCMVFRSLAGLLVSYDVLRKLALEPGL